MNPLHNSFWVRPLDEIDIDIAALSASPPQFWPEEPFQRSGVTVTGPGAWMCASWWSVSVKPLRAATSTRVAAVCSDLAFFERSTQESRDVWLVAERSPSFGVRRVVVDLHVERRTRLRRCESYAKLHDPFVIEDSPGGEVAVVGESVTPLARC